MKEPILYTVFHLNLAFSSVEKEDRENIIQNCYWPLLNLASEGLPVGIEATSYTLSAIKALDPEWINTFRSLIKAGKAELIGSGYCQIIGPLVPPEVTRKNLRFALADYLEILGCVPQIALVNEQAYSRGIVPLYQEAGFKAIMMDWAEPASHNENWQKSYSQRPMRVMGSGGTVLPVIWSDAISFQKFQRYAYGELTPEEYFDFLSRQVNGGARAIPLYTSDAEVFDYRPGRFQSEAPMDRLPEFERIRLLFETINNSADVRLALPCEVIASVDVATEPLSLETSQVPVPVKKQRKYNLTRWGNTGREDLYLNTYCWRQFSHLMSRPDAGEQEWRDLCRYWSSDFRTHITERRWKELLAELPVAEMRVNRTSKPDGAALPYYIHMTEEGRFLLIEAQGTHLVLNKHRGLAIQSFGFGAADLSISGKLAPGTVIGTLQHGFFEDIAYGADFYSGHYVFEPSNAHKETDLKRCAPEINWDADEESVVVTALSEGLIKTVRYCPKEQSVSIAYDLGDSLQGAGSRRLGYATLNPHFFDISSLFYGTHNGGDLLEIFSLHRDGKAIGVDHGKPVSRLVSASTALGMTGGVIYLGDSTHVVGIEMKRNDCAGLGMISCAQVRDSFFVRAYLSVEELDETRRFGEKSLKQKTEPLRFSTRFFLGKTSNLLY